MSLLSVENLSVSIHGTEILRDVSLSVEAGQIVGVIGESGSGKSVTALSSVSLLPSAAVVAGSVKYQGEEMVGATEQRLRQVRGNDVSFIFQEPMTALNPLHTVGHQIAEPLRLHKGLSRAAARAEALAPGWSPPAG